MLEVLLFSLSISIDAFGYSFGFGSRNILVNKFQFLLINIINTTILTFFLMLYKFIAILEVYEAFLESLTSLLFFVFGSFYIVEAFFRQITELRKNNENFIFTKNNKYFNFIDVVLLLSVFFIENIFSAIMFYSHFQNVFLFVFSNFIFHYLFFVIGFDFGKQIIKKVQISPSFISGFVFVLLGIINCS